MEVGCICAQPRLLGLKYMDSTIVTDVGPGSRYLCRCDLLQYYVDDSSVDHRVSKFAQSETGVMACSDNSDGRS